MSRSTFLLFRMIRWRLAIAMSEAFLLFLLLALTPIPFQEIWLLFVVLIGFCLTLLMGLHSMLSQTMFPITDRQLAWIPMAAWGLTTLAGMMGLALAQILCSIFGQHSIYDVGVYYLRSIPVSFSILFVLLLALRLLRLNIGFMGFTGFLPMLILNQGRGAAFAPWLRDLSALWPLWAAGCFFLIWEAPRQIAVIRRLDYQEGGSGWVKTRVPRLDGPIHPTWPTRAVDCLSAFLIVALLVIVVRGFSTIPLELLRRNPFQFFLAFLLILPIVFSISCWRINRASGMGHFRAFITVLIEMTGVGYVLRDYMGVARGAAIRCRFCGDWRFPWQAQCPRCGDHQLDIDDNGKIRQSNIGSLLFPRHDPMALAFRVLIPSQALIFFTVFNLQYLFGG